MRIPKTIHYCWFGNNKKPKIVEECITSWKNILPDFKIIEWNETNVDLSSAFVMYAYKKKKWAFVSDYVRLEVLYRHGGVYLDTDMLFLKPIDEFLSYEMFFGAEEARFISCGIIGVIPKHSFIKNCIDSYNDMSIDSVDFNKITIPKMLTATFRAFFDYKGKFDVLLKMDNVLICPKDYFYPYSYDDSETNTNYLEFIRPNTYAIHLWNKSWIEYSEFYYFKKRNYYKGLRRTITNVIKGSATLNRRYLKMIGYSIKQSFKRSK